MANCHEQFKGFLSEIDLTSTKKDYLRTSRDAIRGRIRSHFKDVLKIRIPLFCHQGSFAIKTLIAPIDGEYDIDDGVYLQGLPEDREEWPSAETVHGWIVDAVKEHTSTPPEDKKNCVRVIYKNDYHVDLPIYGVQNDVAYVARKGSDEWPESDPKAFTEWYIRKMNGDEQMRRNVKYFKAFVDYKSLALPSIATTTLVATYHTKNNRDDVSFSSVMSSCLNHLRLFKSVNKPVTPTSENLLEKLTEAKIDRIIDRMEALCADADKAVALADGKLEEATKLWNKHLGDRFPIVEKDAKKDENKSARIIIGSPPKAWGNDLVHKKP